jgi:hypothetical protein
VSYGRSAIVKKFGVVEHGAPGVVVDPGNHGETAGLIFL